LLPVGASGDASASAASVAASAFGAASDPRPASLIAGVVPPSAGGFVAHALMCVVRVVAQLVGDAQLGVGRSGGAPVPRMSPRFGYAGRTGAQWSALGGCSMRPSTFSW